MKLISKMYLTIDSPNTQTRCFVRIWFLHDASLSCYMLQYWQTKNLVVGQNKHFARRLEWGMQAHTSTRTWKFKYPQRFLHKIIRKRGIRCVSQSTAISKAHHRIPVKALTRESVTCRETIHMMNPKRIYWHFFVDLKMGTFAWSSLSMTWLPQSSLLFPTGRLCCAGGTQNIRCILTTRHWHQGFYKLFWTVQVAFCVFEVSKIPKLLSLETLVCQLHKQTHSSFSKMHPQHTPWGPELYGNKGTDKTCVVVLNTPRIFRGRPLPT